MSCPICGAPEERASSHCRVCGYAIDETAKEKWDRGVESDAYEDVGHTLEPGESLLAVTRGKIAGVWRRTMTLNPQVMLSPYVNLGLTDSNLIIQQIHAGTGRAVSDKASRTPLKEIAGITVSDADPMEPGRTARIVVNLNGGASFRLRAAGRMAEAATQLVGVWESLGVGPTVTQPAITCPACQRALDQAYRFCPYCGASQPGEED